MAAAHPDPPRRPSDSRLASTVLAILLILPATGSWGALRWNLHLSQRLRSENRESPQTTADRYFQSLAPFVPASGPVCLVRTGAPDDAAFLHYQLQYALAPRLIVRSARCNFVVVAGLGPDPDEVTKDPALVLIKTVDSELRLYRRRTE